MAVPTLFRNLFHSETNKSQKTKEKERFEQDFWGTLRAKDTAVAATPKSYRLSRGPLDMIVYPDTHGLTDWELLEINILRKELEERYIRSCISICAIDRYLKNMKIPTTRSTSVSYECLYRLHCKDFKDIPESIVEKIPHWINHVISCGQIYHPSIQPELVARERDVGSGMIDV